jgi:hypothetical protein
VDTEDDVEHAFRFKQVLLLRRAIELVTYVCPRVHTDIYHTIFLAVRSDNDKGDDDDYDDNVLKEA